MIPKTFHRIWFSTSPDDVIPDEFEAFWKRLRELHPGWELRTWSDLDEVLGFARNPETLLLSENVAWRSDVARYEILARFGGVYLDADVEPLRPFDRLVEDPLDEFAFAGWEDAGRTLCPTVLGGPPGHPALEDLVRNLPAWARSRRSRGPVLATGPSYLTRRWRRRDDVVLYAPVRFYPVHWRDRALLGGPYPEASYAVHHWNQGWDPEAKARIDARATT